MGQEKRRMRCAWCDKPLEGSFPPDPQDPGQEADAESRDGALSFGICRSCRLDRGLALPRKVPTPEE